MRTIAVFLLACLLCLLPPSSAFALVPLDDADLDDVRGQSGIALAIDDLKVYFFDSGLSIEDTEDNNRINLFDTMVSINRLTTTFGFTLRVYQNQWDYSMIALEALRFEGLDMPALEMNMRVDVMDFSFYDATAATTSSLGSLHAAGFSPSEFALYAAPLSSIQNSATSGVGFQLETRLEIEEFRWVYNDDNDELRFGGLHMAGWFDPTGNDYTDPDTWTPDGRFVIGSIDPRDEASAPFDASPATFHVVNADAAFDTYERGLLRIQLPETQGSIRIAETELGGSSFGPVIIDGVHAHHLQVDLVPWVPNVP